LPAIRKKRSITLIATLITTVVVLGLLWTGNHPVEERVVTIRYLLFALSGFIAFATPYLLFPDPNISSIQLGNISGVHLMRYVLTKMAGYYWPMIVLFLVLTFGDLITPFDHFNIKAAYFLLAVTFFAGLNFISITRYLKSGPDSQFWQESEKGREMRRKFADYFKYPLDPGSIPSLINTLIISATGMIAIVVAATLYESFGYMYEASAGLLILIIGLRMIQKLKINPEKSYYTTNAFFGEFFGSENGGESVVERRKVEQLWWVPPGIRANVWQFMQQLDRKIPAGRVVAGGHFLIWFIAYQRPDQEFMLAMWILFAMAHQLFVMMSVQSNMAPGWLLRWVDSPINWFLTRFWMQLRWLLPLFVSMNLQLFVFGVPGFKEQIIIALFYLLSTMLTSALGVIQLKRDYK
jgi:hypothetical protein